jgi:hypothetical protein
VCFCSASSQSRLSSSSPTWQCFGLFPLASKHLPALVNLNAPITSSLGSGASNSYGTANNRLVSLTSASDPPANWRLYWGYSVIQSMAKIGVTTVFHVPCLGMFTSAAVRGKSIDTSIKPMFTSSAPPPRCQLRARRKKRVGEERDGKRIPKPTKQNSRKGG